MWVQSKTKRILNFKQSVSSLKPLCDIGQRHASAFTTQKKGFWRQHELNMSMWNCDTFGSHFHCPSGAEYALYVKTCDLFTSAHLTEGDHPHSVCFKKKILTVSNIISWHFLNVIIHLLCCKHGQMLCQMHWQQEAYKTVKVTLHFCKSAHLRTICFWYQGSPVEYIFINPFFWFG